MFFRDFTSTTCYILLQAIIVCNFNGNSWTKLEKIAKKLVKCPILAPLRQIRAQNFFHRFYLYYMLHIVATYHCTQFQGKLMKQTWENSKKPNFGIDFGPLGPNLGLNFLFLDFTSTKCYRLLQGITVCNFKENYWTKLEKIAKNLVSGLILAPLDQIRTQKFFCIDFTSTTCYTLLEATTVCNFKEN